jgi:hypothetical protein
MLLPEFLDILGNIRCNKPNTTGIKYKFSKPGGKSSILYINNDDNNPIKKRNSGLNSIENNNLSP